MGVCCSTFDSDHESWDCDDLEDEGGCCLYAEAFVVVRLLRAEPVVHRGCTFLRVKILEEEGRVPEDVVLSTADGGCGVGAFS